MLAKFVHELAQTIPPVRISWQDRFVIAGLHGCVRACSDRQIHHSPGSWLRPVLVQQYSLLASRPIFIFPTQSASDANARIDQRLPSRHTTKASGVRERHGCVPGSDADPSPTGFDGCLRCVTSETGVRACQWGSVRRNKRDYD